MELLQLRYFQKVAELESITKAATFYMIPQPSMSQTISRLEKELKVKLFGHSLSRQSYGDLQCSLHHVSSLWFL